MLKKLVLAILLGMLSLGVATAKPAFNFLAQQNPCGAVPGGGQASGQWCGCYKHYIVTSCKMADGGEFCDDENALFDMLDELGGPQIICLMIPPQDMDMSVQECIHTLIFYQRSCRVQVS